jgi:hypothetical protein
MVRRVVQFIAMLSLLGPPLRGIATSGAVAASPSSPSRTFSSPGTLLLRGAMSSSVTLNMTGAFSVGHAADLNWDLPLVRSMLLNGYDEQVRSVRYQFDIPPASFTTITTSGHTLRRFHWNAPPANRVIHLTEQVRIDVRSSLSPFHSSARYPLRAVPNTVSPYLRLTPALELSPHERAFDRRFARGHRTEQAVVEAVANWVASHTTYSTEQTSVPFTAAWALRYHQATCQGYDNLMAGMLRYLGIPAQIEYGWVSPVPVRLPGPHHTSSYVQWAMPGSEGALHAWLNIYFPGSGWVPFDPQREKFFVDPRHFGFLTNVDAGNLRLGAWTADPVRDLNPVGASLSNGYIEILPGFGMGGKVSVRSHDRFRLTFQRIQHDVTDIQMVSR